MRELASTEIFRHEQAPSTPVTIIAGRKRVVITEVYRYLPGRRLVGRGVHSGVDAIFKLFSCRAKAVKEHAREKKNLLRMHAAQVPAPRLIDSWQDEAGAGLVLEKLDGVTALDLFEREDATTDRHRTIESLFDWIIAIQQRGCLQKDIHLNNFMMTVDGWHMLDAGACRIGAASRREKLNNLVMLAAQFPPNEDQWLIERLAREDLPADALQARMTGVRLKRCRRLLKKTERNCTEYKRVNLQRMHGSARRCDAHRVLQAVPPASSGDWEVLKAGASTTVLRNRRRDWVVKQYNVKSRWHWLKRQFRMSRARRSWRAAHLLRLSGVRTPLPIAYLEERSGNFLVGRAWYIAEDAEGLPLHKWLQQKGLGAGLIDELIQMFLLMHRFRISHGDMKASNILVNEGKIWLIDLDGVRWHKGPKGAREALRKDMRRFLANWASEPEVRSTIAAALASRPELADLAG